jgi:hypothetical protein
MPGGTNGGILGGHPVVTGRGSDDSRPSGILYDYGDPDQRQVDSLWTRSFDPTNLIVGGNASAAAHPLWSGPLTSADVPFAASPFQNLASQVRLSGQSNGQPSPQHIIGSDYLQGTDVGTPRSPQLTNLLSPEWLQPSRGSERPQTQTDQHFHVYARIYHPETSEWPPSGIEGIYGQPSQSTDRSAREDWSAYLQRVGALLPSESTGNPRIDRITELLLDVIAATDKKMGPISPEMRPTVFGTYVHYEFGRRVKELDLPGIGQDGVEHSLSDLEEFVRYGLAGTVRTDVLLRGADGRPLAIYDLKTGNSQLTPKRIAQLRAAARAPDIPIIELRYSLRTAIRR